MKRKIKNNNEFKPTVVVPPGETIRDYINALDITQNELAERLGITSKHLNGILSGKKPITYEISLKLKRVIGSSVEFWMTLETNYQLDKIRINRKEN